MLNIRLSRPPGATRRRSTLRTAMWRHVKRRAFLLASPKVAVFLVIYRLPVFPGCQDTRADHLTFHDTQLFEKASCSSFHLYSLNRRHLIGASNVFVVLLVCVLRKPNVPA